MADSALQDELIPLLRQVALFSRCDDSMLRVVARRAELRDVPTGETVVRQGDESSDEMFLVLRGAAEARIDADVHNTFGIGDHFGELAALVPAPRTADVVTTEASTLAVLNRNQIYSLVDAVPGVARNMIEGLASSLQRRISAS